MRVSLPIICACVCLSFLGCSESNETIVAVDAADTAVSDLGEGADVADTAASDLGVPADAPDTATPDTLDALVEDANDTGVDVLADTGVDVLADTGVDVLDVLDDTGVDVLDVLDDSAPDVSEIGTDADADAAPPAGELWIVRVGDGVSALDGRAVPVSLDRLSLADFSSAGSIALPTTAAGSEKTFTLGHVITEGVLTRSADGRYVTLLGYDAPLGTVDVSFSAASATPRVVARIDGAGTVSTSTTTTSFGGTVRAAVSDNGSRFWIATNSTIGYLGTFGAAVAGTTIATGGARSLTILDGALHGTKTVAPLIFDFAVPYPTTASPPVGLPGAPTTGAPWAIIGFARSTSGVDLLYVCDEQVASSGGGVQRWTKSAGTWSQVTTLPVSTTVGCRALAGTFEAGRATLYATTAATPASLVRLVDDLASMTPPTPTVLMTATTSKAIRGIALRPSP